MPIYDYKCVGACSRTLEIVQASWKTPAPVCCGVKMEKLIPTPAKPQFKGFGFYATDYKDKP